MPAGKENWKRVKKMNIPNSMREFFYKSKNGMDLQLDESEKINS